jgi:hypothetical protein
VTAMLSTGFQSYELCQLNDKKKLNKKIFFFVKTEDKCFFLGDSKKSKGFAKSSANKF